MQAANIVLPRVHLKGIKHYHNYVMMGLCLFPELQHKQIGIFQMPDLDFPLSAL
jgi:hypothetical protein